MDVDVPDGDADVDVDGNPNYLNVIACCGCVDW